MKDVVIVSAARTPIGSFGGTLKTTSARTLGAVSVKEAIKRAGIKPEMIDEVVLGCVLQGGQGQNVSRQIAIDAGIPFEVPSMTVNKVCGSGLRSVELAAQIIRSGDADIVVAGGVESMTTAGYVMPHARSGARMGDTSMVDMMVHDGLWEIFNNYHMGITAENIASQYGITREEQDQFAVNSQQKAEKAIKEGKFKDEIVPVVIPNRKGDPTVFDTDEYPKFGTTMEKVSKLRPAFKKDGTVTAANSSGINDSGCALVVMSREKAEELGLKPICSIVSFASAGVDPKVMGLGPIPSSRKALKKANMTMEQMDLIEANEAFSAQSIAVARDLNINPDILNVNGGAIALGHPIGSSGARILITLIYEMMKRKDTDYGLATLCIGGGMGTAMIIKMER